jgi:thioredoxin 2
MSTFTTHCPACHGKNRLPLDRINEVAKCGKCQAKLLDGTPLEGTSDNLAALIAGDLPVIIDFWAPWCNPCVGFSPVFQDVAKQYEGEARFVKINTEVEQSLAAQYQIRSIPTIMVYKHGKRADMINGALPKTQFVQWLNQALTK